MQAQMLSALLTLMRLPYLGCVTYRELQVAFGSPSEILAQPTSVLTPYLDPRTLPVLQSYRSQPQHEITACVERDLQWLDAHPEVAVVTAQCEHYPKLLLEIARPPPVLFVRGNIALLEMPQLAIVGSRTPSAGGYENAFQYSHFLASVGFTITSGLALGVDAAAHQGALKAEGGTIAVLGTGIDLVYPSRHRKLAAEIVGKGGALVSEFMLNTPSHASNFPRRNRIISGLSLGTLVVEAAVKSGSLITARTAMEQEREVFAIPGSIHNPLAKGCHHLIKNGATLVETGKDIVEQLGGMLAYKQAQTQKESEVTTGCIEHLTDEEKTIIEAIGHDPIDIDTLCERCSLDVGVISGLLIGLELKQAITQDGNYYARL